MEDRQQIQDIPRALRETLEKGRAEYEGLVRRTPWRDGPVYICGCGASSPIALAGVYAFEWMLGWPVVARSAAAFEHYSTCVLGPKSVVLIISASGETPEAVQVARAARARGSMLLALTSSPSSPLGKAADGVFLTRSDGPDEAATTAVCQHAALSYIALTAARTLRRPSPQWDALEEEFEKLPEHVEWVLTQLSDGVHSLASALKACPALWLLGGGFYHSPAVRGARQMKAVAGLHAQGMEPVEFCWGPLAGLKRGEAVLCLSGARSKMKKELHLAAAEARVKGAKILSITDSNDRELAHRSDMAVFVPALTEVVGSTLTLALLECLAVHTARSPGQGQASVGSRSRS